MKDTKGITTIFIFTILMLCFSIGFSQNNSVAQIIKNLQKAKTENKPDETLIILYKQLFDFYAQTDIQKAVKTAHEAINYFRNKKNMLSVSEFYDKLADLYLSRGINTLALENYLKSQKIKSEAGSETGWDLVNIGNIYYAQGTNPAKAKELYTKALEIFNKTETENSLKGRAVVFNNFALIFYNKNQTDSALYYARKSFIIRKKINDLPEIVHSNLVIGSTFQNAQNYDSAIYYFSAGIYKSGLRKNCEFIVKLLTERANSYSHLKNYTKALADLKLAENIALNSKKTDLEKVYNKFSKVYEMNGNTAKAIIYSKKSIQICDSLILFSHKAENLKNLAILYNKAGKPDSAYFYLFQSLAVRDLLQNEELERMQFNYEIEQNEKETDTILQDFKNLKQANNKRIIYIIILIILIAISTTFGFLIYFSRKNTNIANQNLFHSLNIISNEKDKVDAVNQQLLEKNIEAEIQRKKIESYLEELKIQKEKIEIVHKDITDSLEYAKTIQTALLPSDALLKEMFKDFLIVFEPKDLISGDFYYAADFDNFKVFAVGDCTGHGVPGAFLSILAISHLNEILRRQETSTPAGVLNILRERIKGVFKFFGSENSNGLDLALCAVDTKNKILQYAGAFNPLIIIRNNKIIEYKATRNPIGFYHNEIEFENHIINIKENDKFYIFTDGFEDQIGGPSDKKFSKKRFRDLLLSVCELPFDEQKSKIKSKLTEWKNGESQIDDITILAVKWQSHLH